MRVLEHTPVVDVARSGAGLALRTANGPTVQADRVALGTNAFPSLLRRLRLHTVPVYDYVLMSEPLSPAQLDAIGWRRRQGIGDSANQFHYYRLTADNRILWGGYDAIYHFGRKVRPGYDQRPATFHTLAAHFFETFPQLEGLRFTHRWGGAIDTCTRFFAFYGTAFSGRAAYALGYTGLGVGASRFGADVMLDLLSGRAHRADRAGRRTAQAAALPAGAAGLRRHPGDPLVAAAGRPRRGPAQPVAARPRPGGPRLRLLTARTEDLDQAPRSQPRRS